MLPSHFSNTKWLNEDFGGGIALTLEGQEGRGRKWQLEVRLSHLQVAAEVEITRDVSSTKSLALIMGLDGYAR